MAIYLCPAGNPVAQKHYEDTVEAPVDVTWVRDVSLRATLMAAHPSGSAPMWGSTPGVKGGHRSKHRLMRKGDIALFYAAKRFYAAAVIAVPFLDAHEAGRLWGHDATAQTWELMFSFSEVLSIDVAVEDFNAAVGYAPNKYVQGFSRLDDEKSKAVLRLLGPQLKPESSVAGAAADGQERNLGSAGSAIRGTAVQRLKKGELAARIAAHLGIGVPKVAEGSSVDSPFMEEIHRALTGQPTGTPNAYRRTESTLDAFGLAYDPYWDTSEMAPKGGSTITNRAFSRILCSLTGRPRCFVINVSDFDTSGRFVYDSKARAFNDAGPGSLVVFTVGEEAGSKGKFVGAARVAYIHPGWIGPWAAEFDSHLEFPDPVVGSDVIISGQKDQHPFTEIEYETYVAILERGGVSPDALGLSIRAVLGLSADDSDPSSEAIVERRLEALEQEDEPEVKPVQIPDELPVGHVPPVPDVDPEYTEGAGGSLVARAENLAPGGKSRNQKTIREIEERSVGLVRASLEAQGWGLEKDCQADGVGYDLSYARYGQTLHVEVKGIAGNVLAFNLTHKEKWRAENDEKWILIAVTNVLSPDYEFHVLDRQKVLNAPRTVLSYRVAIPPVNG